MKNCRTIVDPVVCRRALAEDIEKYRRPPLVVGRLEPVQLLPCVDVAGVEVVHSLGEVLDGVSGAGQLTFRVHPAQEAVSSPAEESRTTER